MRTFTTGKQWNRHWYLGLLVLLMSVAGLMPPAAMAQQGTASVNGVVKDQTGAAIPNAQVELKNVNTGVVRTTTSNSDGAYYFPGRGTRLLWHAGLRNRLCYGVATAGNSPGQPDCDV